MSCFRIENKVLLTWFIPNYDGVMLLYVLKRFHIFELELYCINKII